MPVDDVNSVDSALGRLYWWVVAFYLLVGVVLGLALYSTRLREMRLFWLPLSIVISTKGILSLTQIAWLSTDALSMPAWLSFCNYLWRGLCATLALWVTIGPFLSRAVPYWQAQIIASGLFVASGCMALVFPDAASSIRAATTLCTIVLLWWRGLRRMTLLMHANKALLDQRASNDVDYDKRGTYKMLRTAHFLGLLVSMFMVMLKATGALAYGPEDVVVDLMLEWTFLLLLGAITLTLIMYTRPQWWDANAYAANSVPAPGDFDVSALYRPFVGFIDRARRLMQDRAQRARNRAQEEEQPVMMRPVAPPLTDDEEIREEPLPAPLPSAPPATTSTDLEEDPADADSVSQALLNNNNRQ